MPLLKGVEMICKRIIVMSSLIVICLFIFTGCQKESVKTDSAMHENGWRATVVKIEDSGIMWVMNGDQSEQVKLMDIYLPNYSDPQYTKAKKYLEDKMLGKKVLLKPITIDGSTTMCQIYVGLRCINIDILEEGLAWYFPKHGIYGEWLDAFQKAQRDKKGIWSTSEDQIKLPLELSREIAARESLKEMFAMTVLPFVIYHNPYKPSYGSTGSSSGGSSKSEEMRSKESELRAIVGSIRSSDSLDTTQRKALEAAVIKGEINRLQR